VAVGVTDCVPPVPGKLNVVLSMLSEITTCVALVAVTVSVEASPVVTVVGLAAIATVGAVGGVPGFGSPLPQEVAVKSAIDAIEISVAGHNQRGCSIGDA